MRIDTTVLGAVTMLDAGIDGPAATSRRYDKWDYADAYRAMVELGQVADSVGFDTMWYTEHHFQHEGYEVIPNQILLGSYTAAVTERMNFGQMFNIVPQWNPLRLAEDFAAADILTGGRMRFGVGRGTVPREMQTLGASIESTDNALDASAEDRNRAMFEEAMALIKTAWYDERFAFSGAHFQAPPPGIPDRDSTVQDLSLVPTVLREIEVYQACTSPRTLEYVAREGHIGVYQRISVARMRRMMERQVTAAAAAGRETRLGDEQLLVIDVCIGDTHEGAMELARPGHDEQVKLLAPYGRFRAYDAPDGSNAELPITFAPTLEQSMAQRVNAVGTAEEVAEVIAGLRDALDLQRVSLSFDSLGMTNGQIAEQMRRFADDVAPLLDHDMTPERQIMPARPVAVPV